jgi:hypothetical protein
MSEAEKQHHLVAYLKPELKRRLSEKYTEKACMFRGPSSSSFSRSK